MRTDFVLFSPVHWTILAALPPVIWLLVQAALRYPDVTRRCLGGFLIANELTWYVYRLRLEGFRFPGGLPLELCDLTLWLTAIAALTLNRLAFEVSYFAGVGGAGMAMLTPDLWAPALSYPTFYFFSAHAFVVITPIVLAAARLTRIEFASVWRAFGAVSAYAVLIGVFNAIFRTNYMYLCEKPETTSLLDLFGPWPWYLAGGVLAAIAIFLLLYLPFRLACRRPQAGLTG